MIKSLTKCLGQTCSQCDKLWVSVTNYETVWQTFLILWHIWELEKSWVNVCENLPELDKILQALRESVTEQEIVWQSMAMHVRTRESVLKTRQKFRSVTKLQKIPFFSKKVSFYFSSFSSWISPQTR